MSFTFYILEFTIKFIAITVCITCTQTFTYPYAGNRNQRSQIEYNQSHLNNLNHKRLLSFDLAAHGIVDSSLGIQPLSLNDRVSTQPPFQPQQIAIDLKNQTSQTNQIKYKKQQRRQPIIKLTKKIQNKRQVKTIKNETFLKFATKQLSNAERIQKITRLKGTFLSNQIQLSQKTQTAQWRNRVQEQLTSFSQGAQQQYHYYEQKYHISIYQELPFCIVIPTYNNKQNDRYLRNIRSIIMQNYNNYYIVVFDDASTDQTGDLISDFLKNQDKVPKNRYQIIKNTQKKRAMLNLRRAANQFCNPEQIFMVVDGDDQLLGKQVLKVFNAYFQKENAWFVYSNFIYGQDNNIGYSRPFPTEVIQMNIYRDYPFVTNHLRAFYTQLFRNIKQEDLKDDKGEYFKAANDVAIIIPSLQQSHLHVSYLPELTYYYNRDTGLNNHQLRQTEQRNNENDIRRRASYQPIQTLFPKN